MAEATIILGRVKEDVPAVHTYYAGLIIDGVMAEKGESYINISYFKWYRDTAKVYAKKMRDAGITNPSYIMIVNGNRFRNSVDLRDEKDVTRFHCDEIPEAMLADFQGTLEESLGFNVRG